VATAARPAINTQVEASFDVVLGQHQGGHLIDHLVEGGAAAEGQGLEALMTVIEQANSKDAHGRSMMNCLGLNRAMSKRAIRDGSDRLRWG